MVVVRREEGASPSHYYILGLGRTGGPLKSPARPAGRPVWLTITRQLGLGVE